MKTRISAIACLLCIVGYPLSASAGAELPDMSLGTIEPYVSVMAGIAVPRSADATFTDGTQPTVIKDVDYQTKFSWGGNAGIWFPTRNKLAGFDLGVEITGMLWYADVACCKDFYNNDPTGSFQKDGLANQGKRPKTKFKFHLPGRFIPDGFGNPAKLLGIQLGRPTRNRLRQQSVLPPFSEISQPTEYRSNIYPECCGYTRNGFSITHSLHSLLTHHLQRMMIVGSSVRIPFAFHATILS